MWDIFKMKLQGTKRWNPKKTEKDPHLQHKTGSYNANIRRKPKTSCPGTAGHWLLNRANKLTNGKAAGNPTYKTHPADPG